MSNMESDQIIEYVPVRKKNQLVITYDTNLGKYVFTDNDLRYLLKVTQEYMMVMIVFSKDKLYKVLKTIENKHSLNPFRNSCKKVVICNNNQISLKVSLYVLLVIFFILLFYVWLGVFIFFLGDPVMCFVYGYFVMYQCWWRGGRVSIEILLEYRKTRPLENYLKRQNQQFFGQKRLQCSVGGCGKWIQIDNLKRM